MNAFSNFTDRTAHYRTEAEYQRIDRHVRENRRDIFWDRVRAVAGVTVMGLVAVLIGLWAAVGHS